MAGFPTQMVGLPAGYLYPMCASGDWPGRLHKISRQPVPYVHAHVLGNDNHHTRITIFVNMSNQEIANLLYRMATYLEMKGVAFKPRAYERVAHSIEILEESVEGMYKKGGKEAIEKIPGVGEGIAGHIEEMIKTGTFKEYKEFKKEIPVKLEEFEGLEGLGPKRIYILYKKLGIRTLKQLTEAAQKGKIAPLPGFGKKIEENILQGIEFVKKSSGRLLLGQALPYARGVIEELKALKEVKDISEAGSLRRRQETIGDIDLLVASSHPKEVLDYFVKRKEVIKIWGRGPTKASVHLKEGFDIDLRVVDEKSWGSALQYFTGSKAHNIKTREIAIKKHLKLNEYGVFRGKKQIAGKTEQEVYRAISLPYFEPEMREDTGEIELARAKKKLPVLLPYNSLKGDLHTHSNWTDGSNTMEEMAREGERMGYGYLSISDHTKSLAMTHGSDEARLRKQIKEIEKLNKKMKSIRILKSAEVDIRKDGTLDLNDEALKRLDVVGVSVHSHFRMEKKEMTERIMRAMNNPNVDILFHPTGRLLQKRDPYQVDMERIIKEAKNTGTILEVNANPERLDLKDEYIRMAMEHGVKLSIDTDAHATIHLRYAEYGIAEARRGWAEAKDIINTLPLDKMLKALK